MSRMARVRAGLVLALVACVAGTAVADVGEGSHSLEPILDCFVNAIPPSVHGRFTLEHDHVTGPDHTATGEYWANLPDVGARKVVIASPDAWNGKAGAYLFSEGDALGEAWGWKQGEPAAKRIPAKSPDAFVFHTDVSFEDFARFARIVSPGQIRRLPDGEVDGREAYVVEIHPGPDAQSDFDRVVTWIDKKWCTPLRREGFSSSFEGGARPLRVYSVDPADVKQENGFARVSRARLQNLAEGTETRVQLVDLEIGEPLPKDFFTPEHLPHILR